MDVTQQIVATAQRYGVDPALALEVATAESSLNPNTPDSSTGAIGLFQLEPATAAQLGVDPRDPVQNIDGGVRYLGMMLAQFGDVSEALGAYNWGASRVSQAVAKYGPNWLSYAPGETQNYVQKILGNLGTQYQVRPAISSPVNAIAADVSSIFGGGLSLTDMLILGALGLMALWLAEG
jgi:soluble lytic murein transglycosylase-like protein